MAESERLGQYTLLEPLGKGSLGFVYKGFDPVRNRTVALKTIPRQLLGRYGVSMARIQSDARAASALKHPGIVAVYEFCEVPELGFVAMEYVEGWAFSEQLRLPLADAVAVLTQLLDALDYAHEQGVVHQNLKPSNLLLTPTGFLKITDFGVARVDVPLRTQDGPNAGGISYKSPEQFMGLPVDRRSDVFSAGVIFYELLTGISPFAGSTGTLLDRVCNAKERAPSQVVPDVPAVFDEVCARALAKIAHDRFPTSRAFNQAIRNACESALGSVPQRAVSEGTIALVASARAKAPAKAESGQTPQPRAVPATTVWDESTLRTVEQQLAIFVGPLARIIVKEAASRTTDLDRLYSLAAESLDHEEERRIFLARRAQPVARAEAAGAPPQSSAPVAIAATSPVMQLTASAVEDAARQLAPYVGPIANVLARKAATKAGNLQELHRLLAEHLTDNAQREAFLHKVGTATEQKPATPPSNGNGTKAGKAKPVPSAGNSTPAPKDVERPVVNSAPRAAAKVSVEAPRPVVSPKSAPREGPPEKQRTLASLLGPQPPSLEAVVEPFVATVEALAEAFAANPNLEALTPDSVRFDESGKATIRSASAQSSTPIGSGGAIVNPRYAAPESLAEKAGDNFSPLAAHIYALGFMFYEILLGKNLFDKTFAEQDSDLDWLRWHADLEQAAPELRTLLPSHPVVCSELLSSMMEKHADRRLQNLDAVLARLRTIARQAETTMVLRKEKREEKATPPQRNGHVVATIFAVVVLLAVAGVAAYLWQNPELYQKVLSSIIQWSKRAMSYVRR